MRLRKLLSGVAVAGLLAAASMTQANTLTPLAPGVSVAGGSAATTTFSSLGTVVASITDAPFATLGANGVYSEDVILEAGGTYDFAYTFNDSGGLAGIDLQSGSSYNGYTTNVGTDTGDGADGTLLPTTIARSSGAGLTINDTYPGNAGEGGTAWVIVQTNARSYAMAAQVVGFQDGNAQSFTGFTPAPAPASLWGGVGLLGMMGIFGMRRRMRMA